MNTTGMRRGALAAAGLVVGVALAIFFLAGRPSDADPKASGATAAASAPREYTPPPENLPRPDASAVPELPSQEEKEAEAEPPPAPPVEDEEPEQGDGDGPEEAPFAIPPVESRIERQMSWTEKATQTRVMVGRLEERVTHTQAQLDEARRSGDPRRVHLAEVTLERLRRRTEQLRQQAGHEAEQAQENHEPPGYRPELAPERPRDSYPPDPQ